MGWLADVIAFARETVSGAHVPETRIDRDGTDAATAGHFSCSGDDAPPLRGDLAYVGDDAGAGVAQALGYQDPATVGTAAPGEKRIYARSGPGVVAAEIWLKADGSIVAVTANGGRFELGADGSALIAGALGELAVDALGNVTVTTPLGTIGVATHTHTIPSGVTGPPVAGS